MTSLNRNLRYRQGIRSMGFFCNIAYAVGYSYSEIGEMLGVEASRCRVNACQARKRFKAELIKKGGYGKS